MRLGGARLIAQVRSTAGLEGKINENPLSFAFWRFARFAGFEGRCVPWCGFVIAAALIRFPCRICYRLWSWFKCHECSPLRFKNYSVRVSSNLVIGEQRCCIAAPSVSLTSANESWPAARTSAGRSQGETDIPTAPSRNEKRHAGPESLCLTLTKNGGAGGRVFTIERRF